MQTMLAKAVNGREIMVSLVASKKKQNTRDGFKWVEVGKHVLLECGQEIELNLEGRSFYTDTHEMYRLPHRVNSVLV